MDVRQQAIVETVCKASMADSFAEGEAGQFAVMQANVGNNSVIIKQWSPEMLAAFKGAWDEVASEEAAKDDCFKEILDDMDGFRGD